MIGWTVYPLLHTLFLLPVFPTYWLETLCCYGTLTLLLYLHNQVCGIAATASRISCGVAVGICVGVSVYFSVQPAYRTGALPLFPDFLPDISYCFRRI